MSFTCVRIKNRFHINGFALSLALKKKAWGNSGMAYSWFLQPRDKAAMLEVNTIEFFLGQFTWK